MDSWLVGAAAAAVYYAEYRQNQWRDRTSLSELKTRMAETGSSPFCGLAPIRELREDVSSNPREVSGRKVSDSYRQNVVSDCEMLGSSGHHMDQDLVSQSSLASEFSENQNLREDQCRTGPRMDGFSDLLRKRSSLGTRYSFGYLHKPLSSLDSCLMAQLYMQHVKMEEYMCTSHHSPPTTISRPLIVTDGSHIISKASGSHSDGSIGTMESKLHNQDTFEKSGCVFGIPPLPEIKPSDLSQKLKFKRGNRCDAGRSIPCKMDTETQFHSQRGPDDGGLLLGLGISIGLISSYIGNQREVSKLRGLLKQTENAVQDLHDKLEMKDSLTVKEIANEKNESQETYDDLFHDRATNSSSVEQNFNNSKRCYGRESHYDKVGENSESMSQIEAELEAELERLGLNMNASDPERRLSNLDELDPDFVVDFAEGELISDTVNAQAPVESVSNEDRGGTSTTHSGNYAVSPRELSSRLHKVIQSELERRIEELEMALQNSQRKVKLLESGHKNSQKISNIERKYNEEFDCVSDPPVMEVSEEAPDAYNEAREELSKPDDSEEEDDARLDMYQSNNQDELQKYDQNRNMSCGNLSDVNGSFSDLTQYPKNTLEEETNYGQGRASEDLQELLDVSEDECSDCDDEMEKKLIEKIVKKTKEGSHPLLNAQRILFSLNEV